MSFPPRTRRAGGRGPRECAAGALCGVRHSSVFIWAAGGAATALALMCGMTAGDAVAARAVLFRSDPDAIRLLRDAARAGKAIPYEGTEVTTAWHSGRATTTLAVLAHRPSEGTLIWAGGTPGASGGTAEPTFEPDAGVAQSGLGGLTPRMLDLLAGNYAVMRVADDRVCGRATQVVEARRADGTAAGRFWIDQDSGVMLHRELIDQAGGTVISAGFQEFSVLPAGGYPANYPAGYLGDSSGTATGRRSAGDRPTFRLMGSTVSLWGHELVPAEIGALGGWQVPHRLPAGLLARAHSRNPDLTLYEARRTDADGTVHLAYSDGLSAVSVFVQSGELDESRLAGWRRIEVHGHPVFERDAQQRWAVWGARGQVYTVVADAPRETTDAVVAALPHGPGHLDTGLWKRLRRGLNRLTSRVVPPA